VQRTSRQGARASAQGGRALPPPLLCVNKMDVSPPQKKKQKKRWMYLELGITHHLLRTRWMRHQARRRPPGHRCRTLTSSKSRPERTSPPRRQSSRTKAAQHSRHLCHNDHTRRIQAPRIHGSESKPRQQLVDSTVKDVAGEGIELRPIYSDVTLPSSTRWRSQTSYPYYLCAMDTEPEFPRSPIAKAAGEREGTHRLLFASL
jgi:hypothetical protein